MSYRNTTGFGKRIEYKIISELLVNDFDVFIPLVDDHGVDCVVKNSKDTESQYKEIQIKARSKDADTKSIGCFTVDNHIECNNFYFIFYSETLDKRWCFSSKEFIKESTISRGEKTSGRRKIILFTKTKNGYKEKYTQYITTDYSEILK